MRKLSKNMLVVGLVLMIVFINPLTSFAQPTDPGCDPLDPACPIDGGLSLLIAAGIGLGAKKAYDRKRKSVNL